MTSSVDGTALDCRAGNRYFDSRDRTNTQGLKKSEKLQKARPSPGVDDPEVA